MREYLVMCAESQTTGGWCVKPAFISCSDNPGSHQFFTFNLQWRSYCAQTYPFVVADEGDWKKAFIRRFSVKRYAFVTFPCALVLVLTGVALYGAAVGKVAKQATSNSQLCEATLIILKPLISTSTISSLARLTAGKLSPTRFQHSAGFLLVLSAHNLTLVLCTVKHQAVESYRNRACAYIGGTHSAR